jgi:hypothetical protein
VASGGTAPLSTPPSSKLLEGMTPKQQMVLTIMFFVFAPAILGVIGQTIGLDELAGIPSVLIPIGIVWAVFRYKNQMRQLEQAAQQQAYAPLSLPGAAYQQPQIPPSETNPLSAVRPRGSVLEEETQHLPNQPGR